MADISVIPHYKIYRQLLLTIDGKQEWAEDVDQDELPIPEDQKVALGKITSGEFELRVAEDGTVTFKIT